MKKTALLLAAIVIICSAGITSADTITAPSAAITPGWNMMSIPAVPSSVGGNSPGFPPDVLDELVGDGTGLDGRLTRWEASTQSSIGWDSTAPETMAFFGSLLLGDGYWLYVDPVATLPITYSGITSNDSVDMFISLPKAGWNLIGYPYTTPTPITDYPCFSGTPYAWESVKITDGLTTKSLYDASQYGAGWISSIALWWDSAHRSSRDLGVTDDYSYSESMIAWHGYWVRTYKDNLGLILEAPNP